MKITKPDDVLILQGYHARGGKPALMVTLAYVIDADGTHMSEQDVWPWLLTHFSDEPFDAGFKKDRGVFGVAGAAYAPARKPVQAMSVQASVGSLHKTLHVHGDRFWDHGMAGWQISPATNFTSMPVTLSRAFGGSDYAENPYGTGHFEGSEPVQGLPLPNIELPDDPIVSITDRPAVATFSVLHASAPSRMKWVGQVDSRWERERFPWLPDDTDPRWFDGVPSDQGHNAYWQGSEAWSVQGMHATQNDVSGRLPGLRPRLLVRAQRDDKHVQHSGTSFWPDDERSQLNTEQPGPATEAILDLDTVWLFPNEQRVMVMYRAAVAVAREDAADIVALGVFTELASDTPLTTAQWDQHWQEQDDGMDADAIALDVPEPEQDDPELAQIRADHQATTQEWADQIQQDIQDSLDQGAREANQAIGRMEKDLASAGNLDLPRIEAPRIAALPAVIADDTSAMSADEFEAYIKADIQASLDEGEAAMEAAVRDVAKQTDMDPDDLMEQVQAARQNASLADDKTLLEHLDQIDMPDDVRDEVMGKARVFQGEMDDVQAQLDAAFGVPVAVPGQAMSNMSLPKGIAGLGGSESAVQADAEGPAMGAGEGGRSVSNVLTVVDVQACAAAGQSMADMELTDLDLTGIDLGSVDFTAAIITDCDFSDAVLHNATFDRAAIRGCVFAKADLAESSWNETDIENTSFTSARLEQARLTHATFTGCQFDHADFSDAVLDNSSLGESTFDGARFVRASLAVTTLASCRGKTVDFTGGQMAGLRIDSTSDFTQGCFVQADLRGSSLQDTCFADANFNQADLSDAFVSGCDLSGTTGWRTLALRTDFKNSSFHNARWIAANMFEASFDHAVLENLDLSGSNLYAIETRTAVVHGVQVQGALLSRTRLLQEHAEGGGT